MSRENYIRVETRLIASLQRAGYTNDLGLLYVTSLHLLYLIFCNVNVSGLTFNSINPGANSRKWC